MKALRIAALVAVLTGGAAFAVLGQIGRLDPIFAAGGVFPFKTTEATGLANGVAIQNDGKIVFSASATSATLGWTPGYRMVVGRLTELGIPDPDFGGGVSVQTEQEMGVVRVVKIGEP